MTTPKMTVVSKYTSFTKGTAYAVGVVKKSGKPVLAESPADTASLAGLDLAALGVSASSEAITRVPAPNGAVFLLVGLGEKQLTTQDYRDLGGAVARNASDTKDVVFAFGTDSKQQVEALFEGAALALYSFNDYQDSAKVKKASTATWQVISEHKPSPAAINRIRIVSTAVHATRNLVNTPANDMYPQSLAAAVQKAARGSGVTVEIWDEKRLAADGFGGILSVGKGSARPPRLVRIDYKPKGAKAHLALVGKGITFDTGGLSLKPAASMVGMKYDMTGAATVAHAVLAIAELGLPIRATAWMCIAENMVSGTSTRPTDVIKIRNGKTVEVVNTDAEGRLVLADGLSAASETAPTMIVDVATLTGAASVALGDRHTGLMGTEGAVAAVQRAADETGELFWHMPLPEYLMTSLKSDIADIANAKFGGSGGMLLGGLFLKEFIGTTGKNGDLIPWAHLDIAPTANNGSAAYGHMPKGATGVALRTLVALAESMI